MKRSGIVLKLSRYFGAPAFCRSALLITLPILAQNLLTSSFSLIDTLMISSLGAIELTAMGLAASWIQLLNVALLGITSAAGVLVAQFWGGRKLGQVRRSYGGGLGFCLMAALLFLMITALFPQLVMSLYSEDAAVMEAGAGYLRVVAFGFPALGLQHTANAVLRSTERVRTPMYGTIVSVLTNIVLNYTLIYGHFGAPRLGMTGAALASCIANWTGVAVTYTLGFAQHTVLRTPIRQMFAFDRVFLRQYITVAWPIMANELLWGAGTAVLNMIYGHMGTLEYAALTMCTTLENIITTVFLSLANSANVLVGKEIGRGAQGAGLSKRPGHHLLDTGDCRRIRGSHAGAAGHHHRHLPSDAGSYRPGPAADPDYGPDAAPAVFAVYPYLRHTPVRSGWKTGGPL